jgi:PadR family transcriptional regulator PadR
LPIFRWHKWVQVAVVLVFVVQYKVDGKEGLDDMKRGSKKQPDRSNPPLEYDRELLRGNTDSLLLYLISESGRIHGYRLIKEIRQRSEGFFKFREGTVYPALHKLESDGLILGEWQVQPNGQQRRYYRITERGEEVLGRRISMWFKFSNAMNLILGPADS